VISLRTRTRSIYGLLGKLPYWILYAYVRFFMVPLTRRQWVERAKKSFSSQCLEFTRDFKTLDVEVHNLNMPSLIQIALSWILNYILNTMHWLFFNLSPCKDCMVSSQRQGKGMGQDLLPISNAWRFELSDVQDICEDSFHIFYGVQDNVVPLGLQVCIKKRVSVLHWFYILRHRFAFVNSVNLNPKKMWKDMIPSLFPTPITNSYSSIHTVGCSNQQVMYTLSIASFSLNGNRVV